VSSPLEAARDALNNAPEEYEALRQLAHDIMLDSFTLDPFNQSIGHYANSTRVDLRESENGDQAYIELEIKGSHVSALENEIPDEINGVEVRVVRSE
jgi:hypothetical protein